MTTSDRIKEATAVLLLGAGASAGSDYPLPTMKGFFRKELSEKLETFLKWFYTGQTRNVYNLEEVLAYLDLTRTRGSIWRLSADSRVRGFTVSELYDELVQYTRETLDVREPNPCSKHVALFKLMEPKDSVLTVNYDLIADRALREVEAETKGDGQLAWPQACRTEKLPSLIGELTTWDGTPPSLAPWETEYGFFLKLHGSLDWLSCTTPGCRNNSNVFSLGLGGNIASGQREGRPCRYCGAALRTLLVPPVATKRLEDRGRLAFLWNLALLEIARASCVVVVGLSLAPSDFELRWLIRYALQLRDLRREPLTLHVVNPSAPDRNVVSCAFAPGEPDVHCYEDLDEFLSKVTSLKPDHP